MLCFMLTWWRLGDYAELHGQGTSLQEQPCSQGLSDKGSNSVTFLGKEATGRTLGGKELDVFEDQKEGHCVHGAGGEVSGAFPRLLGQEFGLQSPWDQKLVMR